MVKVWLQLIEHDLEWQLDTSLEEALEPPCRVLIHNDEITPFEFVINILQKIFLLTRFDAERVAYVAHTSGMAYVITLPCPEAQRRVGKAQFAAGLEGFPLQFTVEVEE